MPRKVSNSMSYNRGAVIQLMSLKVQEPMGGTFKNVHILDSAALRLEVRNFYCMGKSNEPIGDAPRSASFGLESLAMEPHAPSRLLSLAPESQSPTHYDT
ncbi:hypothetical protein PV08_10253 [Exophiala spinifera]|uniref:Uncharacterized protein n=1 Tax=Exophiala spinifera TaxID=91928 RepID=A0A0D2BHV5_9EURO|nr:uncharacterized protein PV08_10253 [Exophiala spinifera]KIW10954.1 hypothetical protein PV08_10253 [Exophiala spinifera]